MLPKSAGEGVSARDVLGVGAVGEGVAGVTAGNAGIGDVPLAKAEFDVEAGVGSPRVSKWGRMKVVKGWLAWLPASWTLSNRVAEPLWTL